MYKNILIFGDSITQGVYGENGLSWADLLKASVHGKKDFDLVFNLGISGETTEGLLQRFESEASVREPVVIIFAIGINDTRFNLKEEKTTIDKKQFLENIKKLSNLAKKFTNEIVFIGLTNITSKGANGISSKGYKYSYDNKIIQEFDNILEGYCNQNNIKFIKLFGLLEDKNIPDNLHPGREGHEILYKEISGKIEI